jgi:hypothetical protein
MNVGAEGATARATRCSVALGRRPPTDVPGPSGGRRDPLLEQAGV